LRDANIESSDGEHVGHHPAAVSQNLRSCPARV